MNVAVDRKLVIRVLLCIFALLLPANLIALFFVVELEMPTALGFVPLFHFDREANLPTVFSGLQLGIAALLAFAIACHSRADQIMDYRHWFLIAIILTYMGLDDVAHIHENIDTIMMTRLETSGLIHWPWVIPYSILALLVVVYFLPFFLRLPKRTKIFFAVSAAMFVSGAIGCEMIAASHAEHHGEINLKYSVIMTIEESLEMLSITLLIGGLLDYILHHTERFSVNLSVK